MSEMGSRIRKLRDDKRRTMIKKHLAEKQKKMPPSSNDVKDSQEGDNDKKDDTPAKPPRPESPEPNCAICLEPMSNKCFTDSCFHTFCFTCLVEWSKVKPECPLCKQQFTSIVHNVQKDYSYDEYHINSGTNNLLDFWTISEISEPRFRYPTTMTPINFLRRIPTTDSHEDSYYSQIASHRMRYAPHSVRSMFTNANMLNRQPCHFRNRVYQNDLWVMPMVRDRIRTVTPTFFRQNPACVHRLLPWLNRELVALLQNNETQVTFVTELIMELISRYEVTSQEFFIHIEPYLGDKTRHFIHEFYNFAISPHSMEAYDRLSSYSGPSSDGEVRIVEPPSQPPALPAPPRPRGASSLKLHFKRNAKNRWEATVKLPSSESTSNPGPSTSTSSSAFAEPVLVTMSSSEEDSDDDECRVIKVLKPKQERTPEIVNLSSDDEVVVPRESRRQPVIDVFTDSDSSNYFNPILAPANFYRYSGRVSPFRPDSPTVQLNFGGSVSSLPWPRFDYVPPTRAPFVTDIYTDADDSMTEIECVYSSETSSTHTKAADTPKEAASTIQKETATALNLTKREGSPVGLKSVIVRPWEASADHPYASTSKEGAPTTSNGDSGKPSTSRGESTSKSRKRSTSKRDESMRKTKFRKRIKLSASGQKPRKKQAPHPGPDSGSDYDNQGKLKLRSVVAHFSLDTSHATSSHRPSSSHKHKDKKKRHHHKERKRHRHKQRIYSDSDSDF